MVKDILVALGVGKHDAAGEYAISIAKSFNAHLVAVAVAYDPVVPGTVIGAIPPEVLEAQRAEAEKNARAAVTRFEKAADRAGVTVETHVINATVAGAGDQLGRLARRFDLAVVGQPEREEGFADEVLDESVLFESGRPVIVVPYIQKEGIALNRVMVCWDGSRAATRAIADSMPFLRKAKQVDVVIVANGKKAPADEVPGADLGAHLARHGLKVDVKRVVSPDTDVASTVLSEAADIEADMIVMGGYGHSRLREMVLGGVTRGIFESMTVPTLMSH
jgi:nucleotide-binding universal stress UspA family protein